MGIEVTTSPPPVDVPPVGALSGTVVIPAEAPERPSSAAILSLKDKRAALAKDLHIDLQVPRWRDPEIFVRYGPIDATRAERTIANRQKSGVPEWNVLANADLLILSCIGVFACLDGNYDDKFSLNPTVGPTGAWTRFDSALGENLGVFTPNDPVAVIRALYATDGDLINAAARLVEWSGKVSSQLDQDFSKP